jgi:hypothetical protein
MSGYGSPNPGPRGHRQADRTTQTFRATARITGAAPPSGSRSGEPGPTSPWWEDIRHAAQPPVDPGAGAVREPARADRSGWHWLLLIPMLLPLVTPMYNRIEPRLAGVPFFYWFQLAFVGLDIAVVTLVYQATKRRGRS